MQREFKISKFKIDKFKIQISNKIFPENKSKGISKKA